MARNRLVAVVLMAVALLLLTIGAVNADLVTTGVLHSWDDDLNRWENGNLTMFLNNQPQPFYTQLAFDNDPHADACGVGTSSAFAGDAIIGLYHTDNAPAGTQGFQSTGNWLLVKCSTFATNKTPAPADILATCISGNQEDGPCVLIGTPDTVIGCSTGNCTNEIETKFHVNLDFGPLPAAACDGTIDEPFASAGDVCLYWEAQKPANVQPLWKGNFQVRYGVGVGGDKTINFGDLLGPNAVKVSSLAAVAQANSGTLAMWAGALGLAAAALFIWRRKS